jgi:hypothetical protein
MITQIFFAALLLKMNQPGDLRLNIWLEHTVDVSV